LYRCSRQKALSYFLDEPRDYWYFDLCHYPFCRARPLVDLFHLSSSYSLSCAADEGGETRMSGGIPWITLPAGYLGSSLIGACLIACGFDTNASKVACLALGVFFIFTLWWARRNWLSVCSYTTVDGRKLTGLRRTWILVLGMSGLIIMFWFVADSIALRFFVSFSF
jgi:hypothetical protein